MFESSAFIHQTELEFAFQLKNKISMTKVVGPDRGKKTMFERFLYIGNIRSLCKVLRAFGLFPQQGPSMKTYAPDLYLACQYLSFNVQSTSDRFGKIITAMKTLSKFSTHIQRLFKKEEFNPRLYFVSNIPFWTLSMICYMKTSVDNLSEFPMLREELMLGLQKLL